MISVVLLGTGNVASHLFKAFSDSEDLVVEQVYGRNQEGLGRLTNKVPTTSSLSRLKKADAYVVAISDDAISDFSESLLFKDRLVVHTSGSVPMSVLSNRNRKGVFYPLQSFTRGLDVDFSEIPICIEAENKSDLQLLQSMGKSISTHVAEITSEERGRLHLAAVFVNNFVNHMYRIGHDLLAKDGLSFNLLKPLIFETARKIDVLSPEEAQTGPAKRNDRKTIENHLHLLDNDSYKELYTQLTEAIRKTYGKEL